MSRKLWFLSAILMTGAAFGGTFGRVVPIGGEAADLQLDESRGVLYIANFTANRIDVMSLANNTVQTSINVAPNPSSISLSPDNHWLLVAHYGNNAPPASQANALTLIDLTAANAKTTYTLGNPPLGVAFGGDGKALIVTTQEFILFDPTVGTTQLLQTITQVATNAIPQPPASFPGNIVQASMAVSKDGLTIAGFGGNSPYLLFRFAVTTHTIYSAFYSSVPPAGPRTVSVADDGSQMTFAWWTSDSNFITLSEFNGNPGGAFIRAAGLLQLGTSIIDSARGLIYAQVPPDGTPATGNANTPILQILDADNLTPRDNLVMPENLAGKSVITNDHNTVYGVSDSGVLVLPVGNLNSTPRLKSSASDLVFRGNFCNRSTTRQTITITDPGGGNTPFTISSNTPGLSVSPSSAVTPAVITVTVDPNAFSSQKGTVVAALPIASTVAANLPQSVRVLINSQDVSQRGAFVDIPGRVVDILADPKRNVYYVLRQDNNTLLVFDGNNNTQLASLRTCTTPTSMAITFDQQYMLVGCDHSHYIPVFDLDLLQPQPYLTSPADYVQSIAASANGIIAVTRSGADGSFGIDSIDMLNRTYTRFPTLGVLQNGKLSKDSVAVASSNGAQVLIASDDGSIMMYDANANTFTVSRHDFTSLAGAYAASSFGQFVVGNHVLDASGVRTRDLSTSTGNPSGFAFVNQTGYYTTAPNSASPGVIEQINTSTGATIQPVGMVEAPILSPTGFPTPTINSLSCTTTTSGTTTVQTCTAIAGSIITSSTQTCTTQVVGTTTTQSCTTTSGSSIQSAPPAPPLPNAFTRSLAPLPNQNALISLTTSGFTVLPWSYAAAVAPPQVQKIVSAADGVSPAAPGGLISIYGSQLSATNLATSEIPLPTALANSCLTVDGQPMPLIFVSSNQINAQMPSQAVGNVTVQVHTPGGISDNFNMLVLPTAPSVFQVNVAANEVAPTVVRAANGLMVTDSNPIHRGDTLTIYLTGCGATNPSIPDGLPAPSSPLARVVNTPSVSLAGMGLAMQFSGMSPGSVGLCQFNVTVPNNVPTGLGMPLTISQSGSAETLNLRVID